jgi:hypothetical protein
LTAGGAADHLAAMHWLLNWPTTADLIVGLLLLPAFPTGRAAERRPIGSPKQRRPERGCPAPALCRRGVWLVSR